MGPRTPWRAYVYAQDWDPLDESARYLVRCRAVLETGQDAGGAIAHLSRRCPRCTHVGTRPLGRPRDPF